MAVVVDDHVLAVAVVADASLVVSTDSSLLREGAAELSVRYVVLG